MGSCENLLVLMNDQATWSANITALTSQVDFVKTYAGGNLN